MSVRPIFVVAGVGKGFGEFMFSNPPPFFSTLKVLLGTGAAAA